MVKDCQYFVGLFVQISQVYGDSWLGWARFASYFKKLQRMSAVICILERWLKRATVGIQPNSRRPMNVITKCGNTICVLGTRQLRCMNVLHKKWFHQNVAINIIHYTNKHVSNVHKICSVSAVDNYKGRDSFALNWKMLSSFQITPQNNNYPLSCIHTAA